MGWMLIEGVGVEFFAMICSDLSGWGGRCCFC